MGRFRKWKSWALLGWIGLGCGLAGIFWAGEVRAEDLDLTPQQNQAIRELQQEFQKEQQQIRRKILEARLELRALSREAYLGEKGEALRREIRSLMLRARERSLFYRYRALQLLTPEQRMKLTPGSSLGFHCYGPFPRGGGHRPGSERQGEDPDYPR